jgi:hypothetical protein
VASFQETPKKTPRKDRVARTVLNPGIKNTRWAGTAGQTIQTKKGQSLKDIKRVRGPAFRSLKELLIIVLVTTLVINTLLVTGYKAVIKMIKKHRRINPPKNHQRIKAKTAPQPNHTFPAHLEAGYNALNMEFPRESSVASQAKNSRAHPEHEQQPGARQSINDNPPTSGSIEESLAWQPDSPPLKSGRDSPQHPLDTDEKYREVRRLARENWGIRAIAEKLQLGQEEVRLLLDLRGVRVEL